MMRRCASYLSTPYKSFSAPYRVDVNFQNVMKQEDRYSVYLSFYLSPVMLGYSLILNSCPVVSLSGNNLSNFLYIDLDIFL